jgi:hypothetical protein|tara:strand:+ start:1507 stop:1770 length:264 start_codon:yes stop_codon:yes gene_type:complete
MINRDIKHWKKKIWKNIDILIEDEFYAKTPDLSDKVFPITAKAKHEIIEVNSVRSTVEEIDPEMEKMLNEKAAKITSEVVEKKPDKI